MIEMIFFMTFTLGFATPAWMLLLAEGEVCAAAVGAIVFCFLMVELSRSVRLRGKRAEGGP